MEEISDRVGVENYWPWGPSVGDLNADGWQDIFIASSMNFPYRYGINSLLLNNRGGRTHTPWFEADCSQAASSGNASLVEACKGKRGKITVMAPLGSRSSVL